VALVFFVFFVKASRQARFVKRRVVVLVAPSSKAEGPPPQAA
jgi:hypothetical protein